MGTRVLGCVSCLDGALGRGMDRMAAGAPAETRRRSLLVPAKLGDFRAAPVTLELIPVERTVTEPVPILMPAPTLPIPAVNDSPRRPAPVVRPNIAAA